MPQDYEYQPLRLPPGVDRRSTQVQLSIQAEYAGWELTRLRLFRDGSRQVTLRRRRSGDPLPGLSA